MPERNPFEETRSVPMPRYGTDPKYKPVPMPRYGGLQAQPRRPSSPTPPWETEREYNKFQTRANEPNARLAEQWMFDMNRERDKWPWTLDVTRTGQPRGQHKREGQWNVKASNFEDIPTYQMAGLLPGNNSGVMAAMADNPMVQQFKDLYENFDPWVPNLSGNRLEYEWEKPLLGGTLGYGMDYGGDDDIGAFINWRLGLGT